MKSEESSDHGPSPGSRSAHPAGGCPGPLTAALRTLLAHMAEVSDGTALPASEEVELWEDAEFLYLEAMVPEAAELELDLSIVDGRVFVRMAR